ncbi:hypothetical protein [Pseudomonas taetrolens]|uniref:hypothetical protein n=1 Tax=Pseudomonas taetrolens TaxID=47884 RepID=UPI003F9842DC
MHWRNLHAIDQGMQVNRTPHPSPYEVEHIYGLQRRRPGGLRTFLADNKLIHMTANFTNSDAISNVKGGIDTTNAHQSPNKKIK